MRKSPSPSFEGSSSHRRGASHKVKHLYDSSYVKPQHNYRVVQDGDPAKRAVLQGALSRFEKELANKNKMYSDYMTAHNNKV